MSSVPDQKLIKTIKQGQLWADQLMGGSAKSVSVIAKEAGLTNQAVTNMIYRAFLAPDIIRSIMNGTQPAKVTSDFLKECSPFPMDWDEQRKLFGMPSQTRTE